MQSLSLSLSLIQCPTPTYLGVKLDRSLTFRHHLAALSKKLFSRVTLLRRLVGSGWGAGAKTLHIATLSLVYSTAEYCVPVWCRSAHTHLIDNVLNDAFSTKLLADSNILASPEAGRGNCLPYV